MLRKRLLGALIIFAIPILLRAAVYAYPQPIPVYQNNAIKTPDFASFTMPEPPTPSALVKVDAAVGSGKVAVIDKNHLNQFDASELEPLTTALNARGALVEFDTGNLPLEARLKYASAYIIVSPSVPFSSAEIFILQRFVSNGGRLLVFADPTRGLSYYDANGNYFSQPDVNVANPIIAPFGISFVNDYLYNVDENEGNFRNVKFTHFAENALTAGVQMAVFYGAHTVHAETGTLLALGGAKTLSSLTDRGGGLAPLALSANGQVLAVGDFTFLTNPFNQVADNNLLLARIADFALGGTRLPALINFPYLYQRPVSLRIIGNLQLTPELLGTLAMLQRGLRTVNIPLNVNLKASKGTDLLVLGTLPLSAEMKPYLREFNLQLGENNETFSLSGLGEISTAGTGLLLFKPGPESNTLALLADNVTNLTKLIMLMAGGDISYCVVQDNVGLCSLGSGGSSAPTSTPLPSPTALGPLPSPTPVK